MEIFIFIYFSSYLYKSWRSSVKLSAKYILRFCVCMYTQLLQSCPTLCNSTDCSPPGFSLHGILQARILVWVAMSSSRGSSQSRDPTYVSSVSCTGRHSLHSWHHLENLTHATTRVSSEDMMPSEISQSQKDKQCMIPLI